MGYLSSVSASFAIGLIAILGVVVLVVIFARIKKIVHQLEQMHAPSDQRKLVELSRDEAISFGDVENQGSQTVNLKGGDLSDPFEDLMIRGYRLETIIMDNYPDGKTYRTKDVTIEIPEAPHMSLHRYNPSIWHLASLSRTLTGCYVSDLPIIILLWNGRASKS